MYVILSFKTLQTKKNAEKSGFYCGTWI